MKKIVYSGKVFFLLNKTKRYEDVRGVETSSKHSQFGQWRERNDGFHDTAVSSQGKESPLSIS